MYIILAHLNQYLLKLEQNLIYQYMHFEWKNVSKMGHQERVLTSDAGMKVVIFIINE